MTISSSLNASVAGLQANASQLATISDNIANSSTYGYKRATTDFDSMVTGSTPGTYTAGGVGVSVQRLIDERGSLISTTNATDLAVRGGGFLPVTSASAVAGGGETPLELTTTGSFRMNAEGYLESPSGLILMGWPADADGNIPDYPRDSDAGLEPIQINAGQVTGSATTQIELAVNLPATSTEFGADGTPETLSIEYFDNLGKSQTITVTYTPTVPGAAGASNEWTMTLTDSASGGAVIGEYTLQFDDARDTGGTLLNVATVSGGAYDPLTGTFDVAVAGGPMTFDIGLPGEPSGMTQLTDLFSPGQISKDGFPAGNLTSVEVDANGYVYAFFDTGMSTRIYQVPLINVANPNGLKVMDNQTYSISNLSGSMFLWDAADGPVGDIVAYAREESATDVARELTNLIETQRAYSSNAKVIQTVDEMLQETTNIKR
ncbi:flagellar hook protein FlgE [Flavimaricola marinus]|uniref:Flagellar hook protein FlgE n=1 Tax=Flavimaricola marinus TaxID=1819565 RepID=A0A238LF47_9RHOB|nr:flagellar hook protein FlgE [Flavimaricola marinus]SMY08212.1 Flagellar hook protein FlgE [Flavimaricola marinus]